MTIISQNSNLNNYTYTGSYYINGNSHAGTISNKPCSSCGYIHVIAPLSQNIGQAERYQYGLQEYTTYNGNQKFIRSFYSSNTTVYTFYPWYTVYDTSNHGSTLPQYANEGDIFYLKS